MQDVIQYEQNIRLTEIQSVLENNLYENHDHESQLMQEKREIELYQYQHFDEVSTDIYLIECMVKSHMRNFAGQSFGHSIDEIYLNDGSSRISFLKHVVLHVLECSSWLSDGNYNTDDIILAVGHTLFQLIEGGIYHD